MDPQARTTRLGRLAGALADQLTEGAVRHGQPDHHTYAGYLDPWRGEPAPDPPDPAQLREQVRLVLDDLRGVERPGPRGSELLSGPATTGPAEEHLDLCTFLT